MEAKNPPQRLLLSLLLGFSVAACDGATVTDPQPLKITPAQVAGTYALQTYNGESLPHVLRSSYSGEFVDGAWGNMTTPFTIDPEGLLTLQFFPPVTFLGPKDPPGTYTAHPPGQQYPSGGPPNSGSVVINADGTCALTLSLWQNPIMGTCRLTHHLLEWTGAELVLRRGGKWTATRTHRNENGSRGTYTDEGTFTIDGSRILFAPALPPSSPGCTTTASLAGEVLTTVAQCQGTSPPQDTSVWRRAGQG